MKKYVYSIALVVLNFLILTAFAQEVEFNLRGENLDRVYTDISDFKLTLGLDPAATDSLELDERDKPACPPALFSSFTGFVVFVVPGANTEFIEEFKPTDEDSLVWRVRVEFGDHSHPDNALTKSGTAPADSEITAEWDDGAGGSLFDIFADYNVDLVDGVIIVDMKVETSYTFVPTEPNEMREVFIVLRKQEQANTVPVASDDSSATLRNTSVDIDVLQNDIDVERSELTIVENSISDPPNGTAEISPDDSSKIRYTPDSDFIGEDEFTYEIFDGTDTSASATVTVLVDEVVFTRTHEPTAVPSEGLEITITVKYSDTLDPETDTIVLEETFPRVDTALSFWKIPAGSGLNGLDIVGDNPPTSAVDSAGNILDEDPSSPTVTFTWEPPLPNPNDSREFTFTYTITGAEADVAEKSISGEINDGSDVVTTFRPFAGALCHPADTDDDGAITIVEFVTFCGPVAAVFRRGSNGGEYCYDGTNLRPKSGTEECAANEQRIHFADTDADGTITIVEFVTFCGPVAAVFRRGINGGEYCCNGSDVAPNTTTGCPEGFERP